MYRTCRFISIPTLLGLASIFAPPVSANFDTKVRMVCSDVDESDPRKPTLVKQKFDQGAIVRVCLLHQNGTATDQDLEQHALVFDSETIPAGELHVVRRCDGMPICSLSTVQSVEIATKSSAKKDASQLVALYELLDVGSDSDGSMICKIAESVSRSSDRFKFKASCTGQLEQDGVPCSFDLKTGRPFNEEGVCVP
jgi:hypothetical protein